MTVFAELSESQRNVSVADTEALPKKHCLDKLCDTQTRAEAVGTGVFAPLNTVHVRFRGVFIEAFKICPGLCKGNLNEVSVTLLYLFVVSAGPKVLTYPLRTCSLSST